jgi:hypothetical protein
MLMQKNELKARVDAAIDEWSRNLDVMKAKADSATGDSKVAYAQKVADLQKQYDDLKIKAAVAWDAGDDRWDSVSSDLERTLDDWLARAKKAWDDLTK